MSRNWIVVGSLLLSLSAFGQVKVSEADFNKYVALQKATAVRDAKRNMSRGDKAKMAAADAEYEQARKAAGLSEERFNEIDNAWSSITSMQGDTGQTQAEKDEYLKSEFDPATVALIQKRGGEVQPDKWRQEAEGAQQSATKEEATGKPASIQALQGSWKFDQDASAKHIKSTMGIPDSAMQPLRDQWKAGGEATYTFTGENIEVKTVKNGKTDVEKGKFRVEGNQLIVTDAKGKERKLTVGLKSPTELVFSMMGVGTVYKKQ